MYGFKILCEISKGTLKFHTKFWIHTPQNMHFNVFNFCVWVTISLNCDVISLSETGPRWLNSIGVTWASWRIRPLTTGLFCQQFFQAYNKENITAKKISKFRITGLLWRNRWWSIIRICYELCYFSVFYLLEWKQSAADQRALVVTHSNRIYCFGL